MTCADGTGAFMGFTVAVDWQCLTDDIAETQAMIRNATDAITVDSLVKVRSFTEWESLINSFESANVDDGCGSINRMRKGCGRSNPTWSAVTEFSGSEYAVEALAGAEGTIARYNPDGSRREAYGWCIGGVIIPSHAADEESLGRLDWQWEGGKPGDRGFVQFFDAAGTEQFPTMPQLP